MAELGIGVFEDAGPGVTSGGSTTNASSSGYLLRARSAQGPQEIPRLSPRLA